MIATLLKPETQVQLIDLNNIELGGGTQSRAGYDEPTITEYVEAWERGDVFPPIEVYFDGENYWPSDGFHRVTSRKHANVTGSTIAAIVHQGTRRDAVLASVSANATHGLKRTNADKRRAVMTLLRDPEWSLWANSAIAKACGVDETLVRTIKSELSSVKPKMDDQALAKKCGVDVCTVLEAKSQVEALPEKRTAQRNGKTYSVKTAQIGKSSKVVTSPDELFLTTENLEVKTTEAISTHAQLSSPPSELQEQNINISDGTDKDAPANTDQSQQDLLEKEASPGVLSLDNGTCVCNLDNAEAEMIPLPKEHYTIEEELKQRGEHLGWLGNSIQVSPDAVDVNERTLGIPPLELNDICITFRNNVEYLSHDQIEQVWQVLAPHISSDSLKREIELRHN